MLTHHPLLFLLVPDAGHEPRNSDRRLDLIVAIGIESRFMAGQIKRVSNLGAQLISFSRLMTAAIGIICYDSLLPIR